MDNKLRTPIGSSWEFQARAVDEMLFGTLCSLVYYLDPFTPLIHIPFWIKALLASCNTLGLERLKAEWHHLENWQYEMTPLSSHLLQGCVLGHVSLLLGTLEQAVSLRGWREDHPDETSSVPGPRHGWGIECMWLPSTPQPSISLLDQSDQDRPFQESNPQDQLMLVSSVPGEDLFETVLFYIPAV